MENNAAFIAMAGPARALDTIGGQVTWQSTAFGAICVGLMSMFIVGRHTRAEEESGRDELVRAAAIGRLAPMTAALIDALLANLVVGVFVAASLASYPLEVADSIALGVGLTLCGWVFTGTALIAAQLTASTRSMYGIAGAVIGVAYVLRAIGDVGTPALTWLSPIGWYQGMHAFSGLRWWPALLLLAGAAVATLAAYAVFQRRDIGSGVLAARPGPGPRGRRAARPARPGLAPAARVGDRLDRRAVPDGARLRLDRRRRRRPRRRLRDLPGPVPPGRRPTWSTASTRPRSLMLALIACGFAISSALRPRGEEDAGGSSRCWRPPCAGATGCSGTSP